MENLGRPADATWQIAIRHRAAWPAAFATHLLAGTGVLLLAAGTARASDLVALPEPEPQDYVRICNVDGADGTEYYSYIPGTETCLRIGGYLRTDIGSGNMPDYGFGSDYPDDIDSDGDGVADTGDGDGDTYYMQTRFALRLDARSETELGALIGSAQINFNYDADVDNTGDYTDLEYAFLELGGLRVGMGDSYFSAFNGYAGAIISDDLGVPYGPFETHHIGYTYDGSESFSAMIAVENGAGDQLLTDYVPHVTVGAMLKHDPFTVSLVGGYDSVLEEGAAKFRLDLEASDTLSLFGMVGYSTNDPDGIGIGNVDADNYYARWNGDWAVWGGGSLKATEKAMIHLQVSYDEDSNFAAVADLAYKLVDDFTITPEIAYRDNFDVAGVDAVGGYLRFERNF